jgi:hypothetical protein
MRLCHNKGSKMSSALIIVVRLFYEYEVGVERHFFFIVTFLGVMETLWQSNAVLLNPRIWRSKINLHLQKLFLYNVIWKIDMYMYYCKPPYSSHENIMFENFFSSSHSLTLVWWRLCDSWMQSCLTHIRTAYLFSHQHYRYSALS